MPDTQFRPQHSRCPASEIEGSGRLLPVWDATAIYVWTSASSAFAPRHLRLAKTRPYHGKTRQHTLARCDHSAFAGYAPQEAPTRPIRASSAPQPTAARFFRSHAHRFACCGTTLALFRSFEVTRIHLLKMAHSDSSSERLTQDQAQLLQELYGAFGRVVYSVGLRYLRSHPDAEDLTQDVFLHLVSKLATYKGQGSLEGWVRRVAQRTALMRIRTKRMRSEARLYDDSGVSTHHDSRALLRLTIDRAIQEMSNKSRHVFLLRLEGYKHREIAAILGIGVESSKARMHRARTRIRLLLDDT